MNLVAFQLDGTIFCVYSKGHQAGSLGEGPERQLYKTSPHGIEPSAYGLLPGPLLYSCYSCIKIRHKKYFTVCFV